MLTELLGFCAGIIIYIAINILIIYIYLTAGTDEVSMGMVKRVLYTPPWGSCRDPEAVSSSRNKTGDKGFT